MEYSRNLDCRIPCNGQNVLAGLNDPKLHAYRDTGRSSVHRGSFHMAACTDCIDLVLVFTGEGFKLGFQIYLANVRR